jgi:peroxidase
MVTQMGQFLDHDITLTPEEHEDNCCPSCFPTCFNFFSDCFSVQVPIDDPFYSQYNQRCLEFTRSVGFCTPEDANKGVFVGSWSIRREQLNAITAFVDASNVYSSTEGDSGDENQQEAWDLRKRDGTGKMKIGLNNLLPKLASVDFENVATAGDVRAREMPGLASMHTIFLREHNRICDLLAFDTRTLGWGDEAFYQNARRILIAQMQNVVYGEYLPMILGSKSMQDNGVLLQQNSNYDPTKDPSILNSFATAAFRFGHSMIQGNIRMFNVANGNVIRTYPLSENFFNLENYEFNNG